MIFRGIERVLHILIGIAYLGMRAIARQGEAFLEPLLSVSNGVIEAIALCGTIGWGIGAVLYYLIFLRHRLVPGWLALWGLLAMAFSLFASVYGYFISFGANSMLNTVLNVPIALQELVLAVWLIIRGVKKSGNE